jgi:hypothetical protein
MIDIKIIEYKKKGLVMKLILWFHGGLLKFLQKNVSYILLNDNGQIDDALVALDETKQDGGEK